MMTVSILQAKSQLSKLIREIDSGARSEVVITRRGRPVARILPFTGKATGIRLGVAEGQFEVPDDIDAMNPISAEMFYRTDEPER